VLETLVGAISDAGYTAGRDGVAIALDPAASEFYRDGSYHVAGQSLSSDEMIGYYTELVDQFPIWSIEDGLAEDDGEGSRGSPGSWGRRSSSSATTTSSPARRSSAKPSTVASRTPH